MRAVSRQVTEWGMEIDHPELGTIFIDQDTLVQLAEQGRYDSQFGKPTVTLMPGEGAALVHEGLAVKETRGGYHGTDKLRDLMMEWGWN